MPTAGRSAPPHIARAAKNQRPGTPTSSYHSSTSGTGCTVEARSVRRVPSGPESSFEGAGGRTVQDPTVVAEPRAMARVVPALLAAVHSTVHFMWVHTAETASASPHAGPPVRRGPRSASQVRARAPCAPETHSPAAGWSRRGGAGRGQPGVLPAHTMSCSMIGAAAPLVIPQPSNPVGDQHPRGPGGGGVHIDRHPGGRARGQHTGDTVRGARPELADLAAGVPGTGRGSDRTSAARAPSISGPPPASKASAGPAGYRGATATRTAGWPPCLDATRGFGLQTFPVVVGAWTGAETDPLPRSHGEATAQVAAHGVQIERRDQPQCHRPHMG
jgi:hypothetical protein